MNHGMGPSPASIDSGVEYAFDSKRVRGRLDQSHQCFILVTKEQMPISIQNRGRTGCPNLPFPIVFFPFDLAGQKVDACRRPVILAVTTKNKPVYENHAAVMVLEFSWCQEIDFFYFKSVTVASQFQ